LKEEGWQQKDIAVDLGVSEGAVSHWVTRGREGGEEALKAHPPKGVAPRLSVEQKAQIPSLLTRGAEAYGFRGDVWTASRVAVVIERTFGVRYHRDHVGKLMREAGWSRQKPVERASQRNDEAIKKWSEERWPDIKKADQEKATIHRARRSGLLSVTDGGS
jgi:transposase